MKNKKTVKPASKVKPPQQPQTNISNCNFHGVQWDATAIKTVQTVADALLNITKLFSSQNIQIDTLLKISGDRVSEKESV